MFFKEKCTACGRCNKGILDPDFYCYNGARKLCGKEVAASDVLEDVLKDRCFYDESDGGVTFSGGECLLQIDFLEQILKALKSQGIHTAVDTAGHVPFEYFERILPYTDLFLYDIKCIDNLVHKKHTGVGNKRILSNLKKLLKTECNVRVRIPVIPRINDSIQDMQKTNELLKKWGKTEGVELLPYHRIGENKYTALGKSTVSFDTPSKETIECLNAVFN
jgi:pyruvate formate lyase activating enzyme